MNRESEKKIRPDASEIKVLLDKSKKYSTMSLATKSE